MAKDSVLFSDISNLAKTLYVCVARMIIACEQALLFGQAKQASRERTRERGAEERPFPFPSQPRRLLARSREIRFTRPNRRACSQATMIIVFTSSHCVTQEARTF